MWEILAENAGTIAVAAVLALIISVIVFRMVKNRKKGKCSCSSGCSGCPFSGKCGGNENN